MEKLKKLFSTNISFLLLLIIIVFLLYGKSINYSLLYLDDIISLKNNSSFMSDIKNLPKIFVKNVYLSEKGQSDYYRPILALSFAIETLFFGTNSKVNHITNLILFILSVYLMYIFLLRLKLNKNLTKLILLLVTVSPVFTSNAVYVSPRAESFLLIFSILSLLYLDKYTDDSKVKNIFFTALFFLLSLWSKESAIVLVAIIPIFLYSVDKFNIRKLLNIYIYILLSYVIYFIFRKIAGSNVPIADYIKDWKFIFENILNGYIVYVNKILIPDNIPVCLYNYSADRISILKISISILSLIVIYYKNFINRKFILLGLSIFILYLLPTFFILQNQLLFHRLLLPTLGLVIIFILLLEKIIELFPVSKKYFLFLWIILFVIFSYSSFLQADKYKNNMTFSINGYKDASEYFVFTTGMASTYLFALDNTPNSIQEKDYKKLNELAVDLCKYKKFDQAEKVFKKLIELNKNTAFCYANLSLLYEEKKDYIQALEYAIKAVSENPGNIDFMENLARMYYLNDKYQQALDIYIKLLQIDKNNSQYCYQISEIYDKIGDEKNAKKYTDKAVEIANSKLLF